MNAQGRQSPRSQDGEDAARRNFTAEGQVTVALRLHRRPRANDG